MVVPGDLIEIGIEGPNPERALGGRRQGAVQICGGNTIQF